MREFDKVQRKMSSELANKNFVSIRKQQHTSWKNKRYRK